jgi:DNA-binding GntR family transcriptional regulator
MAPVPEGEGMGILGDRLDGSITKSSVAVRVLRDAIRDGVLPPGTQLKLNMLADELGMSYTPLREALQTLHSEGLIETRPHSSAVVLGFDIDRARDVYALRELLEPYAARIACGRASYDDIARLITLHEAHVVAVEEERFDLVPDLNRRFHMGLYEISGSQLLMEFILKLWNGVPYQAISLSDRSVESAQEHSEVIAAMRAKDTDRVEQLVSAHIQHGAKAAMDYLNEISQSLPAESGNSQPTTGATEPPYPRSISDYHHQSTRRSAQRFPA